MSAHEFGRLILQPQQGDQPPTLVPLEKRQYPLFGRYKNLILETIVAELDRPQQRDGDVEEQSGLPAAPNNILLVENTSVETTEALPKSGKSPSIAEVTSPQPQSHPPPP